MVIYIDFKSQNDDVDTQEKHWTIGPHVVTSDARHKLIEARVSHEPVEVSLLFWEGTEFLGKAMVRRVAPKVHLELVEPTKIVEPPRRRRYDADGNDLGE